MNFGRRLRMHHFKEKYINPFTDYGFKKLFETAEIAKFTPEQVMNYDDSLKYYRDLKNSIDTARDEGKELGYKDGVEKGIEKGMAEGKRKAKIEVAKKMLNNGIDIDIIIQATGLNKKEINALID